jgi:hypothetical protein
MISWPRMVIEEASRASKKRQPVVPSTPYMAFMMIVRACDSGWFPARLAASRPSQTRITMPGRQCRVREKRGLYPSCSSAVIKC